MIRLGMCLLMGLLLSLLSLAGVFEPLDKRLYGLWLRQRNQF